MSKILEEKLEKMSEKDKQLWALRHTAEHVLHTAMQNLYPGLKKAMGPATTDGFYHDFDLDEKISEEDFPKIEREMQQLINADLPMVQEIISPQRAQEIFKDNPYKLDWIDSIQKRGEQISTYKMGDNDLDICSGPHAKSTGEIKAFKLLSVAGAYWHGSEKNKMLTRIYGTAFPSQKELDDYLNFLEEVKKRDHRTIGRDLDLFSVDDYVGPGLVLWHPKLSIVREEIELYWRKEHRKRGYQYVYTPHVGLSHLWETSGHLSFFKEGMYPPMMMEAKNEEEKTAYFVKPMNCPFHVRIYKSRTRSYRELPLRWCELGNVYRYEESGVLHGMLRVRGFTQDDSHIICREDQFVEEVNKVLDFALDMNKVFGYDNLKVYLSTRDLKNKEKYVGEERIWNLAEKTLKEILESRKIDHKEDVGGAKFYGPAIDLKAVDALGREWQGTTIQLDFNLPERFKMTYIGQDGNEHVPVMLHRTLLGSMERFVGTLIEHYAGAFPIWLSPIQVAVIPITDKHLDYSRKIAEQLNHEEVRVELVEENEKMQNKIRKAETEKVPYMLVIGDREVESNSVSVRSRGQKDLGKMSVSDFISKIKSEIENKR